MIRKIFSIFLTLLFIGWIYFIIYDYQKVKNDEKAVFCLETKIHDFIDGSVEECKGIGYKVYYYNRPSVNVKTDFGPFWIKMKK